MMHKKKKSFKKIALTFSLCAVVLWAALGTGASLAWFTDSSDDVNNIFHFADFELTVSHRLEDGTWKEVDGVTPIFDEDALYEPGYVQIVYLRVENTGTTAFDFYTGVSVIGASTAVNKYGQEFWLHEHLKFGVAIADSEAEMDALVADRDMAEAVATMRLQNYDTNVAPLGPGEASYLALVVRMPEQVGNEANWRGDTIPEVELGIIVKADQQS